MGTNANAVHHEPWNKGKIVGQKAPFKIKDIWALRVRLQMENRVRELALFNLGIDSKLRGCDLVSLKVRDICHGEQVAARAVVMQHKTQRPVQFEITPATRDAVQKWIKQAGLKSEDFVFPSRIHDSPHLGTRQYARILEGWVEELGLDPADYGTHSMRRTKATFSRTAVLPGCVFGTPWVVCLRQGSTAKSFSPVQHQAPSAEPVLRSPRCHLLQSWRNGPRMRRMSFGVARGRSWISP
jgi:Phage integrase family